MDSQQLRDSVQNDRFSKDYRNIFKGTTNRISSLFSKHEPQPQPSPNILTPTMKGPTYKRLRSQKKFSSNTKLSIIETRTTANLIHGDDNEVPSVKKPHGISSKEWCAINCYMMRNAVCRYYGWLSELCTPTKCPKMTAGSRFEYKWSDGMTSSTPESTPAITYVVGLLEWIDYQFKDSYLFPNYDGAYYSRSKFIPLVRDIFKRLLRVFAHLLHHHFEDLKLASIDSDFVRHSKHFLEFADKYDLTDEKDVKCITHSLPWLNVLSDLKYKSD